MIHIEYSTVTSIVLYTQKLKEHETAILFSTFNKPTMRTIYSTIFILLFIFIISSCSKDDLKDNDSPVTETNHPNGIFVHDKYSNFAITNYQLEIYKGEYSSDSLINLTPDEIVFTGVDGFAAISIVPPITVVGSTPGYNSFLVNVGQWPDSGFLSTTTYKVSWVKVLLHDVIPLNVNALVFVNFQNFFVIDYVGSCNCNYYQTKSS